jgi:hypothetical protein
VKRVAWTVGLVAVMALVGAACSGSDLEVGSQGEQVGSTDAPADADGTDSTASSSSTPAHPEGGPTCASAAGELKALLAPSPDLPDLLRSGGSVDLVAPTVADALVVVDEAAAQAAVAGQEEAQANLVVLTELLGEVEAGLEDAPPSLIDAFTPPYFEHGYAAAELRTLAETANLGPCGLVADLVVGPEG